MFQVTISHFRQIFYCLMVKNIVTFKLYLTEHHKSNISLEKISGDTIQGTNRGYIKSQTPQHIFVKGSFL